jgi:hypothetical protein
LTSSETKQSAVSFPLSAKEKKGPRGDAAILVALFLLMKEIGKGEKIGNYRRRTDDGK